MNMEVREAVSVRQEPARSTGFGGHLPASQRGGMGAYGVTTAAFLLNPHAVKPMSAGGGGIRQGLGPPITGDCPKRCPGGVRQVVLEFQDVIPSTDRHY